jgi:hypothetical protein
LIFGFTGCAGVKNSMRLSEKNSAWNRLHQLTEKKKKDEEPAKPVTMTAIWKDSVYEKPGSPSVKGFGGRFFFYDDDSQAVKAEGELIVYGFDDSVKEKTESVADKKFVFRSEEFQQHFSESGIGDSYSVWLPWEKVGGFRKSITLIPMFRLADGKLLKSGQSINILPGKTPEHQNTETSKKMPYRVLGSSSAVSAKADYNVDSNEQTTSDSGVSLAGFESESESESRIRTSTFRVTPNLARRLAQARTTQRATGQKTNQPESEVRSEQTSAGDVETESAVEATQSSTVEKNEPFNSVFNTSNPKRAAFGQPAPLNH